MNVTLVVPSIVCQASRVELTTPRNSICPPFFRASWYGFSAFMPDDDKMDADA
jgi:hypothetical protein